MIVSPSPLSMVEATARIQAVHKDDAIEDTVKRAYQDLNTMDPHSSVCAFLVDSMLDASGNKILRYVDCDCCQPSSQCLLRKCRILPCF